MSDTTRLNRRRFLRYGTLATTATLALPTIVPRRVLGFDGTPGANEEIVLGIIGMGERGNQLLHNIPASGRVAAICDADSR